MNYIKNYTLKEFLKVDSNTAASYLLYLENLQPQNYVRTKTVCLPENYIKKYSCNSLWDLSYSKVDDLKDLFKKEDLSLENMLQIFSLVFSISKHQILNIKILDFYAAYNFIKEEMYGIVQAESTKLQFEQDPKLVMAGIENLNQFGALNIIDSLAGGDLLKWHKVEKMPYRLVFYKLWRDNEIAKINRHDI